MPKFQRQGTHAHESDILHLIDQRFDDLDETVALAGLVPQLHDRLFQVEVILKNLQAEMEIEIASPKKKGPQWSDSEPPAQISRPDDEDDMEVQNPNNLSLTVDLQEKEEEMPEIPKLPTGLSPRQGLGVLFFQILSSIGLYKNLEKNYVFRFGHSLGR